MKVLLSIKPEYAEKIFSGQKKFEFRKTEFKNRLVHTVVVYATMPIGRIIGEFKIKDIHKDLPKEIWRKTRKHSGIDEMFFNEYYRGKDFAIAIEVEYENFTAPQSFMYL